MKEDKRAVASIKESSKKTCDKCGAICNATDTYCKKCYYEFSKEEIIESEVIKGLDNSTLKNFIGKKYDYYKEKFIRSGDNKTFMQFNLAAIFFGPVWFFYRKMKRVGIIYCLILFVLLAIFNISIPLIFERDIKNFQVVSEVEDSLSGAESSYIEYKDENNITHLKPSPKYEKVLNDYKALSQKMVFIEVLISFPVILFNFLFRWFGNSFYKRHIIANAEYGEGGTSWTAAIIGLLVFNVCEVILSFLIIQIPAVKEFSYVLDEAKNYLFFWL